MLDQVSSPAVGQDGEIDWRALLEQAMTMPGSLGNTYCRFHQYSLANQLLLWSQGVSDVRTVQGVESAGPYSGQGRCPFCAAPAPGLREGRRDRERVVKFVRFVLRRSTFPYSNHHPTRHR
jgi:hypothetical protein